MDTDLTLSFKEPDFDPHRESHSVIECNLIIIGIVQVKRGGLIGIVQITICSLTGNSSDWYGLIALVFSVCKSESSHRPRKSSVLLNTATSSLPVCCFKLHCSELADGYLLLLLSSHDT